MRRGFVQGSGCPAVLLLLAAAGQGGFLEEVVEWGWGTRNTDWSKWVARVRPSSCEENLPFSLGEATAALCCREERPAPWSSCCLGLQERALGEGGSGGTQAMYLGATVVRISRVKGMGEGLSEEPGCTWLFPSSQPSQEQRMIVPSQLSCQLWGGGGWEGMLGLSLWEGSWRRQRI